MRESNATVSGTALSTTMKSPSTDECNSHADSKSLVEAQAIKSGAEAKQIDE